MKVLDLHCSHEHAFEGWFASEGDFQQQLARGLLECPLCGDHAIARLPSAPRLNLRAASAAADAAPPAPALQARWLRMMRKIVAHTEDVGQRFAEEARRIHYGQADERAIRGQATREQTEQLLDEGIAVLPLPIPAALKETLQ